MIEYILLGAAAILAVWVIYSLFKDKKNKDFAEPLQQDEEKSEVK